MIVRARDVDAAIARTILSASFPEAVAEQPLRLAWTLDFVDARVRGTSTVVRLGVCISAFVLGSIVRAAGVDVRTGEPDDVARALHRWLDLPLPVLALVTGGSGYFGSMLAGELATRGHQVWLLDLEDSPDRPSSMEFVRGDIRDPHAVATAVDGVGVVFHNVAQVPLARDPALFNDVNVHGMQVLLDACCAARTSKVVHTSSSAVFGVPVRNPVDESTPPSPAESYGWAKYEAELLCARAASRGLDVSIIRPRTILGHGRLGIFSIVFDWVADGADVFVLGKGDNIYQFVHAADLADACIRAGECPGPRTYNIGAAEFGSMSEALEGLVAHAGSRSRVRSLPAAPTTLAMKATSAAKLTPFAPYHWIMYGKSLWFDITRATTELGWQPKYSTDEMFAESFDWFLANRGEHKGASEHRRPVRQGLLTAAKRAFGAGRS